MVYLDYNKIWSIIENGRYRLLEFENDKHFEIAHLTKLEQNFILSCVEQACRSSMCWKHGCIAVLNGDIVASSFNYDYGQEILHGHYSVHAEVGVILECKRRKIPLEQVDLYVVRIYTRNKQVFQLSNSKPCRNCERMCRKNGVKNVYYSYYFKNFKNFKPEKKKFKNVAKS
jgi:deoxycytidylate deaminase